MYVVKELQKRFFNKKMAGKFFKKKTLSDKIVAKLNKPKIKDYDIEDEDFNYEKDKSNGTFVDGSDHDDDDDEEEKEREELAKRDHYVKVSKSKIRDNTINLGEKYTGSKVGRNEIFDEDTKKGELGESAEEEEDGDEIIESDEDILADVTDSDAEDESLESDANEENSEDSSAERNELESEEDDDDLDSAEEENSEEEYKRNRIAKLLDTEKQQIFNRLSTSAKSDTLKGYTITRQGAEYDRILDARIKLQKALIAANSLPINNKVFKEHETNKTDAIFRSTEEKLYGLIEKLIRLRANQLLKDDLIKEEVHVNLKKRKLSDYLEANASIDKACVPLRKSVLMKWSNRVQSASGVGALNQGKFTVINQNVWTQVNNQLGDLERLIKKTKINRRGVTPMGYSQESEQSLDDLNSSDDDDSSDSSTMKNAGLSNIDKSLQTNEYIFDDDDFYRLLLNDMVNKKLDQKQANNSAILLLSKNKMQKNYERMATKGRKLKYTIQDPLVQYEIPRRKYYSWGDDQIDELFAGLFGMNFNIDGSDNENDGGSDSEQNGQEKEDITALRESGVKLFG